MTTYSGPVLSLDGLIYNLDAYNVYSWNIGRRVWNDLSTRRNDAELISDPILDNINGAFNFANGNSQHVRHIPLSTASAGDFEFGTGDFTIEVWIYPQSFSTYTHMFCLNNQNTFALKADVTTGNIYFTSTAFNTFNHAGLSTWTLNLNQWNHVVLKRQSGIAYGYLNGQLKGSKTGFTNNITGSSTVFIRNGGVAEYSQCKIRNVRVYNRSLSDPEILRNYINFSQRTYNPPTVLQAFSTSISVPTASAAIGATITPYIPVITAGGFGQYTYRISPSLPSGVVFNQNTGEITGTSTSISTTNYTITVQDALGNSGSRIIAFNITAPPIVVIRNIAARNLPVNQANVNFTPIVGSDGFGVLTYSITPALPAGLNFNTATGAITGTPTALRSSTTYTVTVTDQVTPTPQTGSNTFTLSVFPSPLVVSVDQDQAVLTANLNTAFSANPVLGSGGFGTLTYSISPALPAGLSLNASTGAITGTPTVSQASTSRTITVTDQATPTPQSGTGVFSLTVLSSLYTFSTFTFNAANTRGYQAPTLATLVSSPSYAAQSSWTSNTNYLNYLTNSTFRGYQLWTVPASGTYQITCSGAPALNDAGTVVQGGAGYVRRGNVTLTQGQQLLIAVGQPGSGSRGGTQTDIGGGGGSFVAVYTGGVAGTPTTVNTTLLMASGGGGGHTSLNTAASQANGVSTQNATASQTGQAGGTNGNGGPAGGSGQSCAGQGAGYFSDAGPTSCGDISSGVALGFFTGLLGGAGTCQSNNRSNPGQGGFGGGGGNGCGGAGGGGGYSGGGGSWASGYGSGGGSFVNTTLVTSVTEIGATATTSGSVIIAVEGAGGGGGGGGGGSISASPFVNGGLMTYDFQGTNGATSTTQTSGSLTTTMTLTSSTISNIRSPAAGFTSLFINGSGSAPTARAEVSGLTIASTTFTWEGWIYYPVFSASAITPVIFSVGNNGQNLLAVRWITNDLIEFRTNINNSNQAQGSTVNASSAPSSRLWQHHAITADGTNYRYYLDGVLIGQTANNLGTWGFLGTSGRQINTYTISNWIGAPFNGTWSNANYWNCRLSNGVIYPAPFTVTKTGMVSDGGSAAYSGPARDFTMAQLQSYGIGWTPANESFFSLDGLAHNISLTQRITNFSGNPDYRVTDSRLVTVPATGTLILGGWVGTPVGIRASSIT